MNTRDILWAVAGIILTLLCVAIAAPHFWKDAPIKPPELHFVTIGEVIALVESNRTIKVNVELEVASLKTKKLAGQLIPRIKANILTELSAMPIKQMRTINGKKTLANRILKQLDMILGEDAVLEVLFTDFVIGEY